MKLLPIAAWQFMVEDLPSGRPAAPAPSLLFYGCTLSLLPRILRPRHPA